MAFPLAAAAGVAGAISGLISARKINRLNKKQFQEQKKTTDQQIKISDYIQSLSKELMARGTTQVDQYGGRSGYNPATNQYESTLGTVPAQLQSASDQEELARAVIDQKLRRQGLVDAEGIRSGAAREAGTALTDLGDFRRGIGAVDPVALAARMRLDRQGAVNAGYDDTQRAAQTLQTRTGSSTVGDALTRLARDRVVAQAQVGDPEVEALQLAENVNGSRYGRLLEGYDKFATRGSNFYDASYAPAPYAGIADAKLGDQQKLDISKFEVAQGGSATASAGIGSAAAGLRQAFAAREANRVNPFGDFVGALSTSLAKAPVGGGGGGFGGFGRGGA